MTTSESGSLPPAVFEEVPQQWVDFFESDSDVTWEHAALCVSALPRRRYKSACEIGCATGLMTERLARRCDEVLGVDVSTQLLDSARERCKEHPHVTFERMTFPAERPDRRFELVLFADIGYFWTVQDLEGIFEHLIDLVEPGGHLLLSHRTEKYPKMPTSGEDVHNLLMRRVQAGSGLRHLTRFDGWMGYELSEEAVARAIEAHGDCSLCGLPNIPRLERHRLDIFERA